MKGGRPENADEKAALDWVVAHGYVDDECGFGSPAGVEAYLAGLLAERERCAKVAEKVINAAENEFARGWNSARGDIAARIRSGP